MVLPPWYSGGSETAVGQRKIQREGEKSAKSMPSRKDLATKKSRYTKEQIAFAPRRARRLRRWYAKSVSANRPSIAGEAVRRDGCSTDSASDRALTIVDNFTRESLTIVIKRGNESTAWTLAQNGRVRDAASLSS